MGGRWQTGSRTAVLHPSWWADDTSSNSITRREPYQRYPLGFLVQRVQISFGLQVFLTFPTARGSTPDVLHAPVQICRVLFPLPSEPHLVSALGAGQRERVSWFSP